ncbi:DHA2 family efflux MFS transporter permease subunit [Saccharopolyspora sp. NPDC047091]|uniref:DHA2 family efflux MFS transporter permease subunit n=1 Tax=Saccharopolyspora sp. NPDC047091 TaxID=3155924 RepID=UPI0034064EB5
MERLPDGALLGLALLVGSAFVMVLNETVMSVALPSLVVDLRVDIATAQWLSSGFLLTMAVVVPTTGYLLQRCTVRQAFGAAMGLFSAGTALCGGAPGFALLLAGRIVQASGTAIMVPLLMTSILAIVPAGRRGQVMGTTSIVLAVAPAVGPAAAGVVLSALGWRWMFWLVLPIGLLALVAGLRRLDIANSTSRARLDVPSVLLAAVAFATLVYGLTVSAETDPSTSDSDVAGSGPAWPWIVLGAVLVAVFVVRQIRLQRTGKALLDLRPCAVRDYSVPLVLSVAGYMALFSAVILLPFYVQVVLGRDSLVAGLVVLPGGVVMGLLGPPVGRAYDRFGVRALVVPASVLLCLSLWAFATLGGNSPIWLVVLLHVLMSIGLALNFTPLVTDALGALPRSLHSHGSAILTTCQQLAAAAGTALFVTVMTLWSARPGAPDEAGIRAAFVVAAAMSTLVLAGTALLRSRRPADAPDRTADESGAPDRTG